MKLLVAARDELVRTSGGVFGPSTGGWTRFRRVFEDVTVLAHVRTAAARPASYVRVDVDGVVVRPVAAGMLALGRACLDAARGCDVAILQAAGPIAAALREALRVVRRPFAVELLGAPGGGLIGVAVRAQLRDMAQSAVATRYVTREHLQRLFPPRPRTFTVSVPDVELTDESFDKPPTPIRSGDTLDLAYIGGFHDRDEGLDVLLAALALCERPHKLDVAGEGPLRPQLEKLATRTGVGQRVSYRGVVPDLRAFLRARDLFVLPARGGLLNSALILAMSCRLPCLATKVGAVDELLDPTELVESEAPAALAKAIDELAADAPRRGLLALANLRRTRDFRISEREIRLAAFLRALRAAA